jgi:hypothetical protein
MGIYKDIFPATKSSCALDNLWCCVRHGKPDFSQKHTLFVITVSSLSSMSLQGPQGLLCALSPPIPLPHGLSVFLQLSLHSCQQPCFLHAMLVGDALSRLPSLHLGQSITIGKANKFKWKHHLSNNDNSDIDQDTIWLQVSSSSEIQCQPSSSTSMSIPIISLLEENIVGTLYSIHSGWINVLSHTSNTIIKVFLHQLRKLPEEHSPFYTAKKGFNLKLSNLIPVYLYGKLEGYAYTVRSNISILSAIESKSNTTIASMTNFIPPHVHSACHTFASWRVYSILILENITAIVKVSIHRLDKLLVDILLVFMNIVQPAAAIFIQPLQRMVQKEFVDSWYNEWYTVRLGHDADYLSQLLPKVRNAFLNYILQANKHHYILSFVDTYQ